MSHPSSGGRGSQVITVHRRGRAFRAIRRVYNPDWPPPSALHTPVRASSTPSSLFPQPFYYEALDERQVPLFRSVSIDRTGVALEIPRSEGGYLRRRNESDSWFRIRIPAGINASFIRFRSEVFCRTYTEGRPTDITLDLRHLVTTRLPPPDGAIMWPDPFPPVRPAAVTICLTGDGYTAAEESAFQTKCQDISDYINNIPWMANAPIILFAPVFHASAESGTDYFGCYGKTVYANTFFSSAYGNLDCELLDGLAEPTPGIGAYADADSVGAELSIVLVNSSEYGGSSDHVVAWFPANNEQCMDLLLHELGHQLGLRDEYDNEGFEFTATNVTGPNVSSDPVNPPWLVMSSYPVPRAFANSACATGLANATLPPPDLNEVGAFQGASYDPCNNFRPQLDCKMRTVTTEFCLVCKDAILDELYLMAGP